MSNEATKSINLSNVMDHSVAWDWENKHVSQAVIDGDEANGTGTNNADSLANNVVEAGTVLICAGPADLTAAQANAGLDGSSASANIRIVPIGLVENASISISKQLNRIYEIGSKQSYIISGRVMGGINMSRVFFDGPSILKVIYRGEVISDTSSTTGKKVKFASRNGLNSVGADEDGFTNTANIGSGNIAMNLESKLFDQPIGLAFIFRDQQSNAVGEIYFEGCNVSTYGMGISARANTLTESISMQFTRVRPIVTASSSGSGIASTGGLVDKPIVGESLSETSGT